ncbi:hypothetical protein FDP41_007168 [Naegleria fowleri]|uniref:Uncharacterized protein n=1 Tax=Naegleria fowleri TaxID=5763 RepID=A0A6A5BH55_NAEFO|nr:uncharacterized protein FDP41_007168 [Naegleria fowleri]KAF0973781.1 hypothetical protein FDP41_007168 [Naegleria fowleri]
MSFFDLSHSQKPSITTKILPCFLICGFLLFVMILCEASAKCQAAQLPQSRLSVALSQHFSFLSLLPKSLEHSSNSNHHNDEIIIYLPKSISSIFDSTQNDNFIIGFPLAEYLVLIAVLIAVFVIVLFIAPCIVSFVVLCVAKCTVNTDRYQRLTFDMMDHSTAVEMQDNSTSPYPVTTLNSGWHRAIHSRLFDTSSKDCLWLLCLVITWLPRKIFCCGLLEACCFLRLTRFHVRNMRVGNRKLDLEISDTCHSMVLISAINHLLSFYTCGLWKALGLMHHFFLSKLDQRLMWREKDEIYPHGEYDQATSVTPENGNSTTINTTTASYQKLIWNETEPGSFLWFSAYCGESIELTHWFFNVLNVFTCSFLGPIIKAWYLRHLMRNVKFGGKGEFVLVEEATNRITSRIANSPNRIMLRSELEGCDLFLREFLLKVLNFLTFGIFGCLFGESFILSFMDDHMKLVAEH